MKSESMIFSWDWKDTVPVVDMLSFQKKNPTLHLYEYVEHGGTFTYYVFAPTIKIARQRVFGDLGLSLIELVKIF